MLGQPTSERDRSSDLTPPIESKACWYASAVTPLSDFQIEVRFVDGTVGIVDLAGLVASSRAGVFAALRDHSVFERVYIDHGVVTWPGGIDIAPDAMHDEIKKNGVWVLN